MKDKHCYYYKTWSYNIKFLSVGFNPLDNSPDRKLVSDKSLEQI